MSLKSISDLIADSKSQLTIEESKVKRHYFSEEFISKENFLKLLESEGTIYLVKYNLKAPFKLLPHHTFTYDNLYYHLIGDERFETKAGTKGDVTKGIVFISPYVGSGKTVLMNAYMNVITRLYSAIPSASESHYYTIHNFDSYNINKKMKAADIDLYKYGRCLIDDIGKEEKLTKDWGNNIRPFTTLVKIREHSFQQTFGTTNDSPNIMEQYYGSYVVRRFFQMCNLMALPGECLSPIQTEVKKELKYNVRGKE